MELPVHSARRYLCNRKAVPKMHFFPPYVVCDQIYCNLIDMREREKRALKGVLVFSCDKNYQFEDLLS